MDNKSKEVLFVLLEEFQDELGNRGCNDYPMENTVENRVFLEKVYPEDYVELIEFNGKLIADDTSLLDYIIKELKKELGVE